jgi:hypothetical protein
VNHAVTVRVIERLGDLNRKMDDVANRQRSPLEPGGQRLPFDVLHHQEGSVAVPADVVERADVRMVQGGDGACFVLEADLVHRGQRRVHHFDGDGAVETGVARPVDFAHPASSDRRGDFIRAELLAGRERHRTNRMELTVEPRDLSTEGS